MVRKWRSTKSRENSVESIEKERRQTRERESQESLAGTIEEDVGHATTPGNEDATPAPHISSAKNAIKRNYALVAASRPAQAPEHPWKQVVYKSRKQPATKPNVKVEDQGRRILFPWVLGQQKSEADLVLALNEVLQKAGEGLNTRFIRVKYAPSGAISALLTEQANAGLLIPRLSNLLIRTVQTVDPAVVEVEILEHWQREGAWDASREGETEAKKLCASSLRFGGLIRVVEKYWEAGSSSVCMTCCGIGHERMGSSGTRPAKCIICARAHKVEEHQCGVKGYTKGIGKICSHVTVKCANYRGNHMANSTRCTSRQKASIKASKERKFRKQSEKEKENVANENGDDVREREISPELEVEIDLGAENWASSPSEGGLELDAPETQDYT